MQKYLASIFLCMLSISVYGTTITPIVVLSGTEKVGEIIISNDTNVPQNYLLSVTETTFPDKGEVILANHSQDLKLSQTMLYLSPGKKQKIKVRDDSKSSHERYFMVTAEEQISKKNQVYATAIASRIFIRPLSPVFKYSFDGKKITNESNGYFMLMIDEQCGDVEKLTKLVKPGNSYTLPKINSGDRVSIEFVGHIKQLVNQCKK